jgi:hypothetical protein
VGLGSWSDDEAADEAERVMAAVESVGDVAAASDVARAVECAKLEVSAVVRGRVEQVEGHMVFRVVRRRRVVYVKFGWGEAAWDVEHGHMVSERMYAKYPENFPRPGRLWARGRGAFRWAFAEEEDAAGAGMRQANDWVSVAGDADRVLFLRSLHDTLRRCVGLRHHDLHGENLWAKKEGGRVVVMFTDLESAEDDWTAVHFPASSDRWAGVFLREYRWLFPRAPAVSARAAAMAYDRCRLVFMPCLWRAFDRVLGLRRNETERAFRALRSLCRKAEVGVYVSHAACMCFGLLHEAGLLRAVVRGAGLRSARRSPRIAAAAAAVELARDEAERARDDADRAQGRADAARELAAVAAAARELAAVAAAAAAAAAATGCECVRDVNEGYL